jgi:hypothetical protein
LKYQPIAPKWLPIKNSNNRVSPLVLETKIKKKNVLKLLKANVQVQCLYVKTTDSDVSKEIVKEWEKNLKEKWVVF